jgi:dGTPase
VDAPSPSRNTRFAHCISAIGNASSTASPFAGHAGETALDECLADFGGFDHNLHALRTVDVLESPYPGIVGLNLSWEVREAMAAHSKRRDDPLARDLLHGEPTLEARVVDSADSLAYDVHDLDDALGYGILDLSALQGLRYWQAGVERIRGGASMHPGQFRRAVIRALIEWQVTDLLSATAQRLERQGIETLEDVRRTEGLVACAAWRKSASSAFATCSPPFAPSRHKCPSGSLEEPAMNRCSGWWATMLPE